MPPRSKPTARQLRLGVELRKLREHSGMTGREAAERLGVSPMQMSHIEVGRIGVGEERLRRLASLYGCTDGALVEALAAMTGRRDRGWWEEYRGVLPDGFLDLAELEHHATSLLALEITQIPGILQTEEHARAVFRQVSPDLPRSAIEARVAYRTQRRAVLDRENPPSLEVLVHEAALRIRVADRRVARAQLRALLEHAERDCVTLRVIPFDLDGFAVAGYSLLYMAGPVPALDTVQLDNVHSGLLLDDPSQVRKHRNLYDGVRSHSLEPVASRALIHRLKREM